MADKDVNKKKKKQQEQDRQEASVEEPEGSDDVIAGLADECDQWKDKCHRALADLQNYQRRAAKERQDHIHRTRLDTIERFIFPAIDDLDRAIQSANDHGYDTEDPIYAGMTLVRQHMLERLKQNGIEPIEAMGVEFDPLYHQAMVYQPTDEYGEGTVMQVATRGYTADGQTMRPASVIVAKKIETASERADDNNEEKNDADV